jgi:hypothetical protein
VDGWPELAVAWPLAAPVLKVRRMGRRGQGTHWAAHRRMGGGEAVQR